MNSVNISSAPIEGRRERKRRETRARIADAAMTLFREHGFTAVTVDDIAERADVSKPTFFNYFPAKDDVVLAWQDQFAEGLAAAVIARPAGEDLATVIETAMTETLEAGATPESFALDDLIQRTPALKARNQAKYLLLETALAEALRVREPAADALQLRLLAMVTIGALRIGSDEWRSGASGAEGDLLSFSRDILKALWVAVDQLAHNRNAPPSQP